MSDASSVDSSATDPTAATMHKAARVRLELFGSKLKNVAGAFKGTSDPYAIVTRLGEKPGDPPQILGRTEVLKNNLSPHWTTHFDLEYTLGRQTRINIGVYDEVRKAAVDKPMGSVVFEVGDVLGSRGNIKAKKLRRGGTIFCRITPAPPVIQGQARIVLRGLNLKSTSRLRKKPSPFLEISAQTVAASGACWRTVYRSEPVPQQCHPVWPAVNIDLELLVCHASRTTNVNMATNSQSSPPYEHTPLRIQVKDHASNGKHRNMGRIETTLDSLVAAQRPGSVRTSNPLEVDTSKAMELFVKEKNVGQLIVGTVHILNPGNVPERSRHHPQATEPTPPESAPPAILANPLPPPTASPSTVSPPIASTDTEAPSSLFSCLGYDDLPPAMAPPPKRPQFVDYISGGCELEMCIAIDFTGSNGDPREPGTLHYMYPGNDQQLNDYEKALLAVGGIIAKYDTDQKFPVWGFGAKYGGVTQHCFRIGDADELHGLHNVLHAYRSVFKTGLTMAGPTVFEEVIQLAAAQAQSRHQEGQRHGSQSYKVLLILTDGAVSDVEATKRIIQAASGAPLSIVIVGIGNADFSAMQFLDDFQTNMGGGRDICQFVEFRKYQHDKSALTEKTLEEIPDQLVDFFYSRGIMPLPPRRLSQTNWDNIEIEEASEEDIDLSVAVDQSGGLYLTSDAGTTFDDTQFSLPKRYQSGSSAPSPAAFAPNNPPAYHSSQPAYASPAPAPPQPSMFLVQVPPGAQPGQQLRIQHPGTGQTLLVTIPAGIGPGGRFGVRY